MRILALGMLELVLGVLWGFVWSFYSWSLVSSGFDGLSYGVLGFSLSLATLLSYVVSSMLYYLGLYRLVMPISATLIGLSYYSLHSGEFLQLAPVMIGFALGGHTISTIRTSSLLSQGNPRFMAYVYSLSLLGFSLGSIAVMSGYVPSSTTILLSSIASGIIYQFVQGKGYSITVKPMLSRDLRLAISSSYTFIIVALILGLAGGLSFYNMDYYMIVLFNASEKDIAFMLAISGLLATMISLAPINIARGDLWRIHGILTLTQVLLLATLTLTQSVNHAMLVYAVRTVIALLSDTIFDTLYTRAPPLRLADLRIPLILTAWDLSSGLGKLVGSVTLHLDPMINILLSGLLMTLYSIIALNAGDLHEHILGGRGGTVTSKTDFNAKTPLRAIGYFKLNSYRLVAALPRYKV